MRVYSHCFHTLYDEPAAVGRLGRGAHYSVFRAPIYRRGTWFHDFAVIWDEDHDERIIWIIEQLFVQDMLPEILFIGERKAAVTVLTKKPTASAYAKKVQSIVENLPSDSFNAEVGVYPDPNGIINDDNDRVGAYLMGLNALWALGTKPIEFTTQAFGHPSTGGAGAVFTKKCASCANSTDLVLSGVGEGDFASAVQTLMMSGWSRVESSAGEMPSLNEDWHCQVCSL